MPTIHFMVGSADTEYLDRYQNDSRFQIHAMPPEEAERISSWSVHRKFCANYERCLRLAEERQVGLCICEDDVIFRENFIECLLETINDLQSREKTDEYVIALYSAFPYQRRKSLEESELYRNYPADTYYGTQCVYYPPKVRSEIADLVHAEGVENYQAPGDMLVKKYCIEHQNLYSAARSLAQHVGGTSTGLGGFHESPTFHLPYNEQLPVALTLENAVEKANLYLETVEPYPDKYQGKGIVICAGGVKYLTCAWVCINMLRKHGCQLPIQVWYLGEDEGDTNWIELVKELGVECHDALAGQENSNYSHNSGPEYHSRHAGWASKSHAIINCPFEEVLFLDADNMPVVDPTFLFDTKEYRETGAIFWSDGRPTPPESTAWQAFGVEYQDDQEQESGPNCH